MFGPPSTALVVDLCGTLVRENTTVGFVRWLRPKGWRGMQVRLGTSWVIGWIGNRVGIDLGRWLLVRSLTGIHRRALYDEGEAYVKDRLARLASGRVLHAIQVAREYGRPVYLATATLDPVARAVAEQLALDGVVCSNLEYRETGECTGRLARDITSRKWATLHEIATSSALTSMELYTDNAEDGDLIENAVRTFFLGVPALLRDIEDRHRTRIVFVNGP